MRQLKLIFHDNDSILFCFKALRFPFHLKEYNLNSAKVGILFKNVNAMSWNSQKPIFYSQDIIKNIPDPESETFYLFKENISLF